MTINVFPLTRRQSLLVTMLRPERAAWSFSVALLFAYAAVPLGLYLLGLPDPAFLKLAGITVVGVTSLWLGARLPIADARFKTNQSWVVVSPYTLIAAAFSVFALFIAVTFATAPTIPFLSAIAGADANSLSQERGEFLKGRSGWQFALLYISTFLVNTIVPYSVVLAYAFKSRIRHALAVLFFLFSISFVQKALFLNLVLPLVTYAAITRRIGGRQLAILGAGSTLLLLAFTYITSRGEQSMAATDSLVLADLLSAQYAPATPFSYFVWRALAVPIFTATDTLVVHSQYFDGRLLLGATSLLLSSLFGIERINLERFVFEYQFGGWNDVANSNTMFLIDGYVNFGWVGVMLFGLIVGQAFRWFRLSPDVAFQSLWTLFAWVLFYAPLLGMLFSNGYLLMFVHALVVRAAFDRPLHG